MKHLFTPLFEVIVELDYINNEKSVQTSSKSDLTVRFKSPKLVATLFDSVFAGVSELGLTSSSGSC